ncbi:MAG: iron-containing alcohol dehydrogenase [Bacteroidales bacterium]|nr:iron-containing alcohol dehydrogenase [Bacteroidales bacterium]
MVTAFSLLRTPKIFFGPDRIRLLPDLLKPVGTNLLIITGSRSHLGNWHVVEVLDILGKEGFTLCYDKIGSEPSPDDVDRIVNTIRNENIDAVISIGGGSVIDAGKAVSAMLPVEGSVRDYLEGVGTASHPGIRKFFIAVPTTSGTGSEATANAVLSETGENGFKRSLRHENFVPDIAIVDPRLVVNCPPHITAASGMDAFTQLLESYLSDKSGKLTDTLSLEGMHNIHTHLYKAYKLGEDLEARSHVSYAALLSGITLANAGLGLVHGFASAIGGMISIPHGIICGKLMGSVNRNNIRKIIQDKSNDRALEKYAALGNMLSSVPGKDPAWYALYVADFIEELTEKLSIPHLGTYGLQLKDLEKIVATVSHKSNPVQFSTDELMDMLRACI